MLLIKITLYLSLFVIFYSYLGYGIMLFLWVKLRRFFYSNKQYEVIDFHPNVTIVIAVFNEAAIIRKKIENTLALQYPKEKLKILFVADGSTDETVAICNNFHQVQCIYEPQRKGKVAAINRAMQYVTTEYVVFCDGNTFLNPDCLHNLLRHFRNPKVGAVAGEKKVVDSSANSNIAGDGEGLYWKYESYLKKLDAAFYTVVGAAGELFAMRTCLYEPVDTKVLLDDFIISLTICKKGFRVMYEPMAIATEAPSANLNEERKRKIRISAGGIQSVIMLKELLNIFKYGKLSFQYISHRVLRWIVCPLLLPLVFILNIYIYFAGSGVAYDYLLLSQLIFYSLAICGLLLSKVNIKLKLCYVPWYFLFMNLAMYLGFVRYIRNNQSVLWDKAGRKNTE